MSEKQGNSTIHAGKSDRSALLTSPMGAKQAILTDVSEHNLPSGKQLSVITYPTGEQQPTVAFVFDETDLDF